MFGSQEPRAGRPGLTRGVKSSMFQQKLRAFTALCLLGMHAVNAAAEAPSKEPTIHTVITTECSRYFTWQTMGIVYSHKRSGQAGPITRLMSCTEDEAPNYQSEYTLVRTHVVRSLTNNEEHKDVYSAYNKPGAVLQWIQDTDPDEDFILVIDADMIMRSPFNPVTLGAARGTAISAFFGYMKGVNNELAMKHVPFVTPRNDSLAGPVGRRGDQVGGFTLMATSDLKKVAPLWLNYTVAVRYDPDAWNLTGDQYSTHIHERPWISEMYGYSFAAAAADVWHKVDYSAMLYPGYFTQDPEEKLNKEKMIRVLMKMILKKSPEPNPPKVLHYGLLYEVPNTGYKFDKHWHYDFDAMLCPPWDLSVERPKGGLFPHPPSPSNFTTQGLDLMRDLLAVEPIIILNAAFCEHHVGHCPASEELAIECGRVADMMGEMDNKYASLNYELLHAECSDRDERCARWAQDGECIVNPGFMHASCRKSCGKCPPSTDSGRDPRAAGGGGAAALRGNERTTPAGPPPPPPRKLSAEEQAQVQKKLKETAEALGKTKASSEKDAAKKVEAADSIWAAQKKMAAKVNAAESSGGPLLPNPDAITTKPAKGHQGPHHKKWFRGREHAVDDADVVSENTLERVLDEKSEGGTDDTVGMGDEPIDRDSTDGLPIEARQAIELEGGEGDLGSGEGMSQRHSFGLSMRQGGGRPAGTRAWWRGRASQQLVLGRTDASGAHARPHLADHEHSLSGLVFWLGFMGLAAWIFTIIWVVPRRRRNATTDMKAVPSRAKSGPVRKKRPPVRNSSTANKARNF